MNIILPSSDVKAAHFITYGEAALARVIPDGTWELGPDNVIDIYPRIQALRLSAKLDCTVFAAPSDGAKKGIEGGEEMRDGEGGRWNQTKDAAKIAPIWKKHPDANLGVPTGKSQGFFVVETDQKHGIDGAASLRDAAANGGMPDTLQSGSPTGSVHHYFQYPDHVSFIKSVAGVLPGVDVRGDKGMVLAPPSRRKDGVYKWRNDLPMAKPTKWLLALVNAVEEDTDNPFSEWGRQKYGQIDIEALWTETHAGNSHDNVRTITASTFSRIDVDEMTDGRIDEEKETLVDRSMDLSEREGLRWTRDRCRKEIDTLVDPWIKKLRKQYDDQERKEVKEAHDNKPAAVPFEIGAGEAAEPMDDWLYGRHLMRGEVAGSASPGGVGKSTLSIAEGLCMASGKNLLGQQVPKVLRVLLINLEDSSRRMRKRILVAMRKHGLTQDDIGDRLIVFGKNDLPKFQIAKGSNSGGVKATPFVEVLEELIEENDIDVVSIDPFVRTHNVGENENTDINAVVAVYERIAERHQCAISLWHHTRKMKEGDEKSADSARGASSFVDACRSVRILHTATEKEGKQMGIGEFHRSYFQSYSSKLNYAPPISKGEWYYLRNVPMFNGKMGALRAADGGNGGDNVGVVEAWARPPIEELNEAQRDLIKAQFAGEVRWREDLRSPMWAGQAISMALGLSTDKDKDQIKDVLFKMVKDGLLRKLAGKADRKDVMFIVRTDGEQT